MDDSDDVVPRSGSLTLLNEAQVTKTTGRDAILEFLRAHSCYDLIRDSGKVVVFDTSIPIQLAFYALLEHDMQAAPLWDSCRRKFVGLMTVVDFIDILRHYHQRSISMEELASQSISHVLGDPQEGKRMQHLSFVSVDINSTLYNACNTLHTCALRFLPVISPDSGGGVLAVISHLDVLNFLVSQFREQRRLFEHSILDLRIGTFENLITVPHNSLLRDVLHVLEVNDISAVPVVDDEGRVKNVYCRSDITFLATATDAESVIANLDMVVADVLSQQRAEGMSERLHTCSPDTSLQAIFELFAEVKFRRVVVVDADARCVGVVSVRDLVAHFVSRGDS